MALPLVPAFVPVFALAFALVLALAGCSGGEASDAPGTSGADALPEGHPDIGSVSAPAGAPSMTGTVLETMDAAGYTYALLDLDGREVWSAGPLTGLEVGERVSLSNVMEMRAFTSNSLGRTFDVIYFTAGFGAPQQAAATPSGTVLQALPASGYVYLEVRSGEETLWLAGPRVDVAEGDRVAWIGGSLMQDFPSSTLDRTFDEILFVDRLEVVTDGEE